MTDGFDGDDEFDDDFDEGAEPATHPRFRARRAEVEGQKLRRRKRRWMVLGSLLVVAVLGAASTQTPLFDVDEIRVVGAERVDPDELRAQTGVELGRPVLGLDTSQVERNLRDIPAIRRVSADVSWNGVLTVEIRERTPVALINGADGTMVIAEDGLVLALFENTEAELSESSQPPDLPADLASLPEIRGAMFVGEVGEFVPQVLDDAIDVAAALPPDIQRVTEGVELTVDSLGLRTVGGGEIALGDARDLEEKFSAVRAFLAQVDLSCLDTLNVQAPTVPVIRRNTGCSP